MAEESFLNVFLIYFQFHSLICTATGFSYTYLHISSVENTGQKILKIFLGSLLINFCMV